MIAGMAVRRVVHPCELDNKCSCPHDIKSRFYNMNCEAPTCPHWCAGSPLLSGHDHRCAVHWDTSTTMRRARLALAHSCDSWRIRRQLADLWAHLAMGIVAREWVGERAASCGRLAPRGHPVASRVGREWVGRLAAVGRPLGSMAPRGG